MPKFRCPKHEAGRSAAVGEDDGVCNAYAGAVGIVSVGRPARAAECEWGVGPCNGGNGEGDVGEVTKMLGECPCNCDGCIGCGDMDGDDGWDDISSESA